MNWSIGCEGPEDAELADYFFQCLGRALYIATLFEQKCGSLSFVGTTIHKMDLDPNFRPKFSGPGEPLSKPPRLNTAITALLGAVQRADSKAELSVLQTGREARNAIAHELSAIGSLDGVKVKTLREALEKLRVLAETLAKADTIASAWAHGIEHKQDPPEWLSENYSARLLKFVFGGPYDALASDRRAAERALRQKLSAAARNAVPCPCCNNGTQLRRSVDDRVDCYHGHVFELRSSEGTRLLVLRSAPTGSDALMGTEYTVPTNAVF